jgi:hypothetical protein
MTYIALSHIKLFAFRIYCSGGAAPPKTPQTSAMAPFHTRQVLLSTFLFLPTGLAQMIPDSHSNVNGEKTVDTAQNRPGTDFAGGAPLKVNRKVGGAAAGDTRRCFRRQPAPRRGLVWRCPAQALGFRSLGPPRKVVRETREGTLQVLARRADWLPPGAQRLSNRTGHQRT